MKADKCHWCIWPGYTWMGPGCGPARTSEAEVCLSSLRDPCPTTSVFPSLPVGVFGFEPSLTNKPKPSKLTPTFPLEPSNHVDQGQRCLHQKMRPFQLLQAGPVGGQTLTILKASLREAPPAPCNPLQRFSRCRVESTDQAPG